MVKELIGIYEAPDLDNQEAVDDWITKLLEKIRQRQKEHDVKREKKQ